MPDHDEVMSRATVLSTIAVVLSAAALTISISTALSTGFDRGGDATYQDRASQVSYDATETDVSRSEMIAESASGRDLSFGEAKLYCPEEGFTIRPGTSDCSISFRVSGYSYDDAVADGWEDTGENFAGLSSVSTTTTDGDVVIIYSSGRMAVRLSE